MSDKSKILVQCGATLDQAAQYFHSHKDGSVLLSFRKGPPSEEVALTDEKLQALLDAIATTQVHIEQVHINPAFIEQFASPLMQIQFYRGIGSIPSLHTLQWKVSRPDRSLSCLQPLTHLLDAARTTLRKLLCHCAHFQAFSSTQEFQTFANALQYHPKLEKVAFKDCRLAPANQTSICILPVIQALATIPKLEHLELSCWVPEPTNNNNPELTPSFQALAQLCHRPYLRHLHLQNSLGDGDCLSIAMNSLKQSRNIQTLMLPVRLQENQCALLGEVIRTNQVLSSLKINVCHIPKDDRPILQIIKAFHDNSTITSLIVDCYGDNGQYTPSDMTQKAIVTMLEQHNNTLTQLYFGTAQRVYTSGHPNNRDSQERDTWKFLDKVQFYLVLNQMGRKHLIKNPQAKRKEWVEVLAQAAENLSALFYFLVQNPSLCEIEEGPKQQGNRDGTGGDNDQKESPSKEQDSKEKNGDDAGDDNNEEESPTKEEDPKQGDAGDDDKEEERPAKKAEEQEHDPKEENDDTAGDESDNGDESPAKKEIMEEPKQGNADAEDDDEKERPAKKRKTSTEE